METLLIGNVSVIPAEKANANGDYLVIIATENGDVVRKGSLFEIDLRNSGYPEYTRPESFVGGTILGDIVASVAGKTYVVDENSSLFKSGANIETVVTRKGKPVTIPAGGKALIGDIATIKKGGLRVDNGFLKLTESLDGQVADKIALLEMRKRDFASARFARLQGIKSIEESDASGVSPEVLAKLGPVPTT